MFKYLHLVGVHLTTRQITFMRTYVVNSAVYMNADMINDMKVIAKTQGNNPSDWTLDRIINQFKDCGHYTLEGVRYQLVDSSNYDN